MVFLCEPLTCVRKNLAGKIFMAFEGERVMVDGGFNFWLWVVGIGWGPLIRTWVVGAVGGGHGLKGQKKAKKKVRD